MSATLGVQANNVENNPVYNDETVLEQTGFFKSKAVKCLAGLTIAAILAISILGILGTVSSVAAGVSVVGLAGLFTLMYLCQNKCKSRTRLDHEIYNDNVRRIEESWTNRLNPNLLILYVEGEDLHNQVDDIQKIAVQEVNRLLRSYLFLRNVEGYPIELSLLPRIFNNILKEMDLENRKAIQDDRKHELILWFDNMVEWIQRLDTLRLNAEPEFRRICQERFSLEMREASRRREEVQRAEVRNFWIQQLNSDRLTQYALDGSEDTDNEVDEILRNVQNEMEILFNRIFGPEESTHEAWSQIPMVIDVFTSILMELPLEEKNHHARVLTKWFEIMLFWLSKGRSIFNDNVPRTFHQAETAQRQLEDTKEKLKNAQRRLERTVLPSRLTSGFGYEDEEWFHANREVLRLQKEIVQSEGIINPLPINFLW